MTKAQEVYDKVEALVASGIKKAEAFRQVADELGQPFNSMRGAYYAHTRTLGGTPSPSGRRQTKVHRDPVEAATELLTWGLAAIDEAVEEAKERADQTAAEYKELRESAATRKPRSKPRSTRSRASRNRWSVARIDIQSGPP